MELERDFLPCEFVRCAIGSAMDRGQPDYLSVYNSSGLNRPCLIHRWDARAAGCLFAHEERLWGCLKVYPAKRYAEIKALILRIICGY